MKRDYLVTVGASAVYVKATSVGNAARKAFRRLITNVYDFQGKPVASKDRPLFHQPMSDSEGGWKGVSVSLIG